MNTHKHSLLVRLAPLAFGVLMVLVVFSNVAPHIAEPFREITATLDALSR